MIISKPIREINKQPDIVINLIKSENNLEKFHPFCKKYSNFYGIKKTLKILLYIIVENNT